MAPWERLAGKGDVYLLRGQPPLQLTAFQLLLFVCHGLLQGGPHLVSQLSDQGPLFLGQFGDAAKQLRQSALAAEVFDAGSLELFRSGGFFYRCCGSFMDGLKTAVCF